jgi:hypothetical protein
MPMPHSDERLAAKAIVRRALAGREKRSSAEARFPRQAGRCSRRQKCSSPNESGALVALLNPAGCSSLITARQVA